MKIYNGTPSAYTESLVSKLTNANEWTTDFKEKETCDLLLYVATADLEGVGHIIDAVNDSNFWKEKTVFCTLYDAAPEAFNEHQKKSLVATGKMVRVNGGHWFENEEELIDYIQRKE